MSYRIAEPVMSDKAKGQRMQHEPGTLPPSGPMMGNCLALPLTPALRSVWAAMPFWQLTDRNLDDDIAQAYRTQ